MIAVNFILLKTEELCSVHGALGTGWTGEIWTVGWCGRGSGEGRCEGAWLVRWGEEW